MVMVVGGVVSDSVSHGVDSGGAVVDSVHGVVIEVVSVSHGVEVAVHSEHLSHVVVVEVEVSVLLSEHFSHGVEVEGEPLGVPAPLGVVGVDERHRVDVVSELVGVEVRVTEGTDVGSGVEAAVEVVLL
jgi:hypothetical protein